MIELKHMAIEKPDPLTFESFNAFVDATCVGPARESVYYAGLGLCGEAGEVAEKLKKAIRKDKIEVTDEERAELLKELGDVVWYATRISQMIGSDIQTAVSMTVDKLVKRHAEGYYSK